MGKWENESGEETTTKKDRQFSRTHALHGKFRIETASQEIQDAIGMYGLKRVSSLLYTAVA